jgi:hypothetical protein
MKMQGISEKGMNRISKFVGVGSGKESMHHAQEWGTYDSVYLKVMESLSALSKDEMLRMLEELKVDIEMAETEPTGADRVRQDLIDEGY